MSGGYLAEEVERDLRAAIGDGTYQVGDKLPTESALGVQYQVSRTVVREAIAGLRAAGLVMSRRGSGVFVTAPEAPASPAGLFLTGSEEGASQVIDQLELRAAVEVQSARLAATRASIGQVEALFDLHRAFTRKIAGESDVGPEDYAFHIGIARATNNAMFERFLEQIGPAVIPRMNLRPAVGTDAYASYMSQLAREHEAILLAIDARDSEAAGAAMEAHLMGSLKRYRELSRKYEK